MEGLKLTGPNGGTIFLPAAGWKVDWFVSASQGGFWSSTLGDPYEHNAERILIYNSGISTGDCTRYVGFPIRPVRKN